MGNVVQAGNKMNPARQPAVHAGLPVTVPAMTVNSPLLVMEEAMRHFYARAVQLKQGGYDAKEINANLEKAVDIAEKVAPYRHHRLAAIKVDTKGVIGRDQHKSLEHLKAHMQ